MDFQRVLQRLARVSFVAGEALEMLAAAESDQLKWLIPHLERISDTVNELMDEIDR